MKFWYALNTKPHSESYAAMTLAQLGLEVFLPKLRGRLVAGTFKRSSAPLFPGYLFDHLGLSHHVRAVMYAKGVRKIVALGRVTLIVDERIIDAIRSKPVRESIELPDRSFSPGQTVKIQDGPLCGMTRNMSD
jgi:transcriptional antiterminator RfaH